MFPFLAKKKGEKSRPNIKSIQKSGNTAEKGKGKVEQKREADLNKTINMLFHFQLDCYLQNHESSHISQKPAVSFLDFKWVVVSSFKVRTVKLTLMKFKLLSTIQPFSKDLYLAPLQTRLEFNDY